MSGYEYSFERIGESNGENFGNRHPPCTASHAASLRARRRLQTARIDVKVRQDVAETMGRRSVFSECKKRMAENRRSILVS